MHRLMISTFLTALGAMIAAPALAESELSFYTGAQTAPHSRVEGNNAGTPFSFLATWEGRSGEAPPYYGFRYTRWTSDNLGFGVDFNHAKVYADDATLATNGFTNLEFTDGLNILTANVFYRWQQPDRAWTPYVGAGLGVAIPHVDVLIGGNRTFEYQLTGPAAMVAAGVKYDFNDRWGMFGEYKGTYSVNEAELSGGGSLSTNIVTNALNIGVSFSF